MRPAGHKNRSSLNRRSWDVLRAVVEAYIESGEPVASRTVARELGAQWSAATIRNVMADLSDEGYLSQPHTSAGRMPTAKAFREYVETVRVSPAVSAEASRLRQEIGRAESLEAKVERSSHVLTQVSRSMGIAAAVPTGALTLHQVESIPLSERRVLMVVVTGDRMVRDKVVPLEREVSLEELTSLRNYINLHFSGWTFSAIQQELRERLEADRASYDRILQRVRMLVEMGLLDLGMTPTLHSDGASNLVGVDLHLTRERMRELFRTLEEKRRLLELLDRFLEGGGEVGVRVGLGDVFANMEELSLVGLTVDLPGGLTGKVAVLGPIRMNYERVMAAVYHVGQALQQHTA